MKFDRKTAAAVARFQKQQPVAAAHLELEGLKLANADLADELAATKAKLADRERRIRLMLTASRMGTVPIGASDWYVSDLADLRKRLPRRPLRKRKT